MSSSGETIRQPSLIQPSLIIVTGRPGSGFQHKLWAPRLELLQSIAGIRIIICTLDPQTVSLRRIERGVNDPARESFHEDKVSEATRKRLMLPFEDYDPPHLGVPTLIVDISREYSPDFDSIVSFANG
jgi:hypothetical protein